MTATPLTDPSWDALTPVAEEVGRGLAARPKTLSPWLFYDAAGSRLFEAICEQPEYYLTRTESGILASHAEEMVHVAGAGRRLSILELGAGTATKTGLLLRSAVRRQGHTIYRPIDVSGSALAAAKSRLEAELPSLRVEPAVTDYTSGLEQIAAECVPEERRLVLYIGSSIGNFDPEDAQAVLRSVRASLNEGDALLLGVDMVKDPSLLLAAYNDDAGVTAAFNRNVLRRINRELGSNFNLERFRHRAIWNAARERVEMHLKSTVAQQVSIPALEREVRFTAGETIHTENSYKFTGRRVEKTLAQAGFTVERSWSDPQGWFGVYLARAEERPDVVRLENESDSPSASFGER